MVMEDGTERSAERMAKLLQSLNEACIITPEQMSQVSNLPYICGISECCQGSID